MPVITALEVQQRNRQRVNVFLDGEFAFGLAMRYALFLKKGQALSTGQIAELQNKDGIEKAYERTLNYLSYRPRSTAEVRQYLKKLDIAEPASDEIIGRLEADNLLNDARFAQLWVDSRTTFRPKSQQLLKAELRQKGLDPATADSAVQDVDDSALARALAQKRLPRLAGLPEQEQRQKLSAFLGRRGFRFSIIHSVLRQVLGASPDLNGELYEDIE
ncbi:MAG TPA: RecX family transcriptional regulator [Anaerolineales bacterium]|nr:RecX family transcriptional regulator [Anaerolineales bacterium]